MSTETIAAIYARKSTDQTGVSGEQRSIARQIEHAKAYAARKSWTIPDNCIFVDDGISGRSLPTVQDSSA